MPGTDTRKIPTKPRRLRLSEPGAHCLRQHEKQTPQLRFQSHGLFLTALCLMLCGLQEDMCLLMQFYRLFEGRYDNLNTKKIKKIKINVDEIAGNFMWLTNYLKTSQNPIMFKGLKLSLMTLNVISKLKHWTNKCFYWSSDAQASSAITNESTKINKWRENGYIEKCFCS